MHFRAIPNHFLQTFFARPATKAVFLATILSSLGLVNGCGSGYQVIPTASNSSVTINAGQTVQLPQTTPVSAKWVLTGTGCNSTSCGTVASGSDSVVYTAPPTVASQIHVVAATEDTTAKFEVIVNPALTMTATLDDAAVDTPYTATVSTSGGSNPARMTLASGSLPSGLQFNASSGIVSGTPKDDGDYPVTFQATDASAAPTATVLHRTLRVHRHRFQTSSVNITTSSLDSGTVNSVYDTQLTASGGTTPYTWTITSGSLPAGLALSQGGVLSGTPTDAGTSGFAVRVEDSNGSGDSAWLTLSILNNTAPVTTLAISSPAAGTVGTAYTGTIGVSGGLAPYACTVANGNLPAGLVLNGCRLTGTPTTAGSYPLTVTATDASSPSNASTANITINIVAQGTKLTIGAPAAATVGTAYNSSIAVSGGTGPYTCSITSGTLPNGIAQNNCALTGTPTTSGTFSLGIKATDSSSPANSGSATISLVVKAAAAQLTLTSPPAATVGKTYNGSIGIVGGTAPYTCSITSGSLPAGITQNNCTLTGTPTASGTFPLGIKVSDSSATSISTTSNIAVRVNAATSTALTLSSPIAATVGTTYTGTIGVSGGTAPYTCSLTSGALPAGIIQNNCTLTGTPTAFGTFALGIKATDASSPANSGSATLPLVVNAAAAVKLSLSSPSAATVGTTYTGTIGVNGGTAPYTCSVVSGTLPAGLTLSGCTLTGTPTSAGSTTLSVKASDSSSPANTTTANVIVTVNSAPSTIASGSPHINYTDLNVGSGTGGDNGNGVYVRIFGNHFGSSQGSSSVTLGGSLVTNCSLCSWSDTQIIAQLGSSATTGQIVVTVNGLQSNGMPFTVTPTTIVFVSPNGSDSNSGSFTSPFKTWRAAFNSVTSNDSQSPSQNTVIYLEPGTDVSFDDGRSYKAAISTDLGGTSATNQLSIVGYPGGTVNVGSSSITNGVHGWGKFITIANLNIVGQSSAIDAEAGNVRIINNSLSCPAPPAGLGGTACVLGETDDPTETWVFQGNNVHDTGGNVDKTYHAVYFSSNVNHADVGWNNVGQNFKGYCRGIMFHATLGDNQYDLHIHDNIVTNSYCDGIALASVNPSLGTVEVYNNVVTNAALASNPYGVANEAGIAINTDPAGGGSSGNVEVYNNTVVNAGAYILGNQNGCFGVVMSGAGMHLTNNICSQPLPTQPYIEKGSTNVSGSNNLWFGAGAAPTWDSAPITLDPLLSTIFSLLGLSPASGAGTTSVMSPFDIIGVPRGSRPSVGAYQ